MSRHILSPDVWRTIFQTLRPHNPLHQNLSTGHSFIQMFYNSCTQRFQTPRQKPNSANNVRALRAPRLTKDSLHVVNVHVMAQLTTSIGSKFAWLFKPKVAKDCSARKKWHCLPKEILSQQRIRHFDRIEYMLHLRSRHHQLLFK